MSPESQQIEIAYASGLFSIERRKGILTGWVAVEEPGIEVPDFLNDLNAINKAELQFKQSRASEVLPIPA